MAQLLGTGILAILDAGICPNLRGITATAKALSGIGIRFFQFRAKDWQDSRQLSAVIELKKAVPGCVITVNDRCDIAASAGTGGVHLGAGDIPIPAARRIMGASGIVGASAGNSSELFSALRRRPDYISFGPAFNTYTKLDAGQALGVSGFARLFRLVHGRLPVLAVGGITPDNAGVLIKTGAAAVAVASWWWKYGSVERAGREMMESVMAAKESKRRLAPHSEV